MSRDFPHLNDTQFPNLGTVDVYAYQNQFNYERWQANSSITLCNVLWNSDYKDVVKFNDNDARDKWFDSLVGNKVQLQTAFHCVRDTEIKVPLPYEVATLYNYMYIDLPIATSESEPLKYEDNDNRVSRWYYFVDVVEQKAPSTTVMHVQLDEWTTFINQVTIPYMILERGHAPMPLCSVDDYLANPIGNTRYLLAPDFDFGSDGSIVADSTFVPIGNGEKYLCYATTTSIEQFSDMVKNWPSSRSGSSSKATYSDTSDRYGYQYQVNGYEWNYGTRDFSNSVTGTRPLDSASGNMPTGYDIHAVKLDDADNYFGKLHDEVPFYFQTIFACYVVSSDMISLDSTYNWTIGDYTDYICRNVEESLLLAYKLTKDMFGYDDKYAGITKLYTSPYSYIEATDNNGNVKKFNIENTGSIELRRNVSIAYPFIRIEPFITGINGSGSTTYSWREMNSDATGKIYDDDFGEYRWEWDIPTYALYMQGSKANTVSHYNDAVYDREKAVVNYHKSLRLSNTDYENTEDAADNTVTMIGNSAFTEYTNEYNDASTQYTNAVNSASTGRTNSNNTAATELANANRSAATSQTNKYNEANLIPTNTALDNANRTYITNQNNSANTSGTSANNGLNQALQAWDAGYSRAMTDEENSAIMSSAAANAVGVIGSAVGNGIASGNPLGMIGSVVSGAANLASSGVTTLISASKNSNQCEAGVSNSQNKVNETNENNSNLNTYANNAASLNSANTNSTTTSQAANQSSTIKTNADNTKSTENSNASATNSTATTNASNTYSTDTTNAANSRDTAQANAARTRDTANANAKLERNVTVANSDYTRKAHVLNAQDDMELARLDNDYYYNTHSLDAPVKCADSSGDMTLDFFRRRGIQLKVRTERRGDIAQAGDLMLRFGYALNQAWNIGESGFNVMKHFTFWKASEVWVSDNDLSTGRVQTTIKDILMQGVTVWNDPTEIGRVSIYDN